jgi:hypothetical protein
MKRLLPCLFAASFALAAPLAAAEPRHAAAASTAAETAAAPRLLEISFGYVIPTEAFRARMDAAAPILAGVPGLLWKVWAIDEATQRASGIYLFADGAAAEAYLRDIFGPHMGANPALRDIAIRRYDVMQDATRVTRGRLD